MSRLCIVVADQGKARFLIQESKGRKMEEIAELINSDARLHEHDLVSDRPGRSFDIKGSGRHAMESKSDIKKLIATRFTLEICEYLEKNRDTFDNLVIISPPGFLGILRKKISDSIAKLVTREIKKDFVHKDIKEIQKFLNENPLNTAN